eukprot:10120654-Karenia_brevis.AAC.1
MSQEVAEAAIDTKPDRGLVVLLPSKFNTELASFGPIKLLELDKTNNKLKVSTAAQSAIETHNVRFVLADNLEAINNPPKP